MSASTAVAPVPGTALRAPATRLARLLRPTAAAVGAWVSTQARIRTAAGLWWPDLVVATGELPVDGILDGPPLLVVELTPAGMLRWADVAEAVVWGVAAQGGVVLAEGALTPAAKLLTVPGTPWLTMPVAQFLDLAGEPAAPPLRAAKR
jgi:hypothetical protein